ncbi:MAG: sodium ion-translocating decarboxylase subunit beta, partial [Proteobacteria bacterium]|nr:sodium ion-translocating decarboxylase subunit beta [Pseudomonadota bacterium]
MNALIGLWQDTGLAQMQIDQLAMMLIGCALLYLAIVKQFEPLLLVPIGFGTLLVNIPGAGFDLAPVYDASGIMTSPGGLLYYIYHIGIETGMFPLLIFMGVGAMTDFGPLLANPRTLLLGAAAQFGIFATVIGAVSLTALGIFDFSIQDAASIGIIGGADGPTAIFVASKLSPDLLGPVAVAAYSYMALVPIIQPPIMRALTTQKEREIKMEQLRPVGKRERILFPLVLLILVAMFIPTAAPLL